MSLSEKESKKNKLNDLLQKFGPPSQVNNTVNLIVNKDIKNYSDLKKEYNTLKKSWEYINIYAIRDKLEKEYFEPEQDNTPVRPPRYYYISERTEKGPFTDPLGNKDTTGRKERKVYKYKDMHKNGEIFETTDFHGYKKEPTGGGKRKSRRNRKSKKTIKGKRKTRNTKKTKRRTRRRIRKH
tara:strand:- start:834 stop:1379 length:546 start_codon:yes stop_codon:yes gene_type:complete